MSLNNKVILFIVLAKYIVLRLLVHPVAGTNYHGKNPTTNKHFNLNIIEIFGLLSFLIFRNYFTTLIVTLKLVDELDMCFILSFKPFKVAH